MAAKKKRRGEPGWKKFERRVAQWFGGKRRGADTSAEGVGKCDVVCDRWSPELTVQKSIGYELLLKKCQQAERNTEAGTVPVLVAKKTNLQDRNALVVFRAETFARHFLELELGADPIDPGESAGADPLDEAF